MESALKSAGIPEEMLEDIGLQKAYYIGKNEASGILRPTTLEATGQPVTPEATGQPATLEPSAAVTGKNNITGKDDSLGNGSTISKEIPIGDTTPINTLDTPDNIGNTDFYVAPNGKTLPGKYKDWIGTNMRESIINSVDDIKLKNAIGEVYRPGSVIKDGGTADVIRFERETGLFLSKSGHIQKGKDMSKYFQKLIDSGTLSEKDIEVASQILDHLQKALGGK